MGISSTWIGVKGYDSRSVVHCQLGHCQGFVLKILAITIFKESSIIDVWQGPNSLFHEELPYIAYPHLFQVLPFTIPFDNSFLEESTYFVILHFLWENVEPNSLGKFWRLNSPTPPPPPTTLPLIKNEGGEGSSNYVHSLFQLTFSLTISCKTFQTGLAHFKNAAKCLKCVWPFWDVMH